MRIGKIHAFKLSLPELADDKSREVMDRLGPMRILSRLTSTMDSVAMMSMADPRGDRKYPAH